MARTTVEAAVVVRKRRRDSLLVSMLHSSRCFPAPTWPVLVQPSTALDGYPTRRPWLKAELKSKLWGLSGRISARRPVAHSTFGARSNSQDLYGSAQLGPDRRNRQAPKAPRTRSGENGSSRRRRPVRA